MQQPVMPESLGDPPANYAHAVLVADAARWLFTSGVVPRRQDGSVPDGVAAQARLVWRNVAALLDEAGLEADDVVSVTTYVLVDRLPELGTVMSARDAFLGGRPVASTLVTVPALAQPSWLLEIAVVAAR